MGIRDLRPVLGDRVDAAFYADEATVITKQGKPRAVIVSHEWFVNACKQMGLPVPEPVTGTDDDEG